MLGGFAATARVLRLVGQVHFFDEARSFLNLFPARAVIAEAAPLPPRKPTSNGETTALFSWSVLASFAPSTIVS